MGTIKDGNSKDLTEEGIKKSGKNTQNNYTKKDFNDLDNNDGVATHQEPDILEYEVKRALGSISMNKAGGGEGISAESLKILKDDTVKVLHSIGKQIWKAQAWA